jgi:hypothetical protein
MDETRRALIRGSGEAPAFRGQSPFTAATLRRDLSRAPLPATRSGLIVK